MLEPTEALARADPTPADRLTADVCEQTGLASATNLRLQPLAVFGAVAGKVGVSAEVRELAPAAVRLRGSAVRPLPLEEVGNVVPAFGRGEVDLDLDRYGFLTVMWFFCEILGLTGERTFV